MKQELVFDTISYTKMEKLTAEEITSMKNKVIKLLKIYVPGYLVLTGIAIWILLRGPNVLNDNHLRRAPMLQRITIDENTTTLFWQTAPWFSLFLFLLTTIFLSLYYFRSVRPFVKDIRQKKKIAVFYRPKKTEMTLFNRYYITIPLYSDQQIEVNKTDFDSINDGDLLCLEMGPSSYYLLSLKNNGRNIHIDDLTL
jgi:hypothetical protein